jgi:hypothetical protein
MIPKKAWPLVGVAALAISACDRGESKDAAKKPAAVVVTSAPASTAPAPTVAAPAPPATGYSLAAIHTIADACSTPAVVLSTAPKKVGADYPWTVSRQALLANQQFRIVAGPPAVPGEVHLATHAMGEAYALVATCKDGGTCNQLAAMYKAIVRSSAPQVHCGGIPGLPAVPVHAFTWAEAPQGNLPGAKDTIGLCARLNACEIATDRSTPGDPFVECQKAPSRFKTACATRYPCVEVMACLAH